MEFCNLKTWVNKDDDKVGDEGYFANDICILEENIERDFKRKIKHIDQFRGNCFVAEIDDNEPSRCSAYSGYTFFLPSERDRKPTYRPFNNIDELFSFLMPGIEEQKIDRHQKAQLLIGEQITLRRKEDNFIKVITINEVGFYDNDDNDNKDNYLNSYLNSYLVDELFHYYEILIDGEYVPFGIEGE